MWFPAIIGLCGVAILNFTVAIGCVLGTYSTHAYAIHVGDVGAGFKVRGRVLMLIVTAVYGFFWIPIWIYNLVAPRKYKFQIDWEESNGTPIHRPPMSV